jgi:hypothetical protein
MWEGRKAKEKYNAIVWELKGELRAKKIQGGTFNNAFGVQVTYSQVQKKKFTFKKSFR